MGVDAAIILGITIGGFCITVLTIIYKQSKNEGRRDQRLETVEKEQEKDREKIRELYAEVNDHRSNIKVLSQSIETVKETTERIENKLDRIVEARGTI